ncbi:hypothetical protein DFH28DRAFT_922336 [Melampsora americana]|nr:hypothetical protein DFH28DRAFT_922336 [Melampsora americana]
MESAPLSRELAVADTGNGLRRSDEGWEVLAKVSNDIGPSKIGKLWTFAAPSKLFGRVPETPYRAAIQKDDRTFHESGRERAFNGECGEGSRPLAIGASGCFGSDAMIDAHYPLVAPMGASTSDRSVRSDSSFNSMAALFAIGLAGMKGRCNQLGSSKLINRMHHDVAAQPDAATPYDGIYLKGPALRVDPRA